MKKGELMKLVYTQKELRSIDSAVPQPLWDKINTSIHVMNYNNSGAFGDLENLYKVALKRGIKIDVLDEYAKSIVDDEYFYNNYLRAEGDPFYTPEIFQEYKTRVSNLYSEFREAINVFAKNQE